MSVIPNKIADQIAFCEAHAPVWAAAGASVGLTTPLCTAFTSLTTNMRKAFNDAQSAKDMYRAAITAQNNAIDLAINGTGGAADLIRLIKAFAENTATPAAIYALAHLPMPAVPTPVPAPGKPTNITVALEPSGAITLKWKSVNASANAGTFFSVKRKLAGESAFNLVSNTGEKTVTDATLMQGSMGATYIIQGHRGALDGPESDQIGVQFGVGGGGGLAVTNAQLKMAA